LPRRRPSSIVAPLGRLVSSRLSRRSHPDCRAIPGPQADLNQGITTYVNGSPMNPIQIDTSAVATDTIAYVATDQSGLTSTTTRTVIIQAAPSIVPTDNASTTASTTAQ
jgi:hypothetical protein